MIEDDAPEVDALPVLAEPATIDHQRQAAPATIAVVRSHPLRRLRNGRRRRRELGRVVASRSFLVDVHLLSDKR